MPTPHTYQRAHNLAALQAELEAAIPALRPTMNSGRLTAVYALDEDGDEIRIVAPDTVTDADIAAVVSAHTNPPPPDMTPPDFGAAADDVDDIVTRRAIVANHKQFLSNQTPTNADIVQQVRRLTRAQLGILWRRG